MLEIDHHHFMKQALVQAQRAAEEDEVPIGAVVVCQGRVIAKGYNQVERLTDVTAHAEMIAITAASEYLGSKFLDDCALYVSLEPCLMCATAIKWSRVGQLYFGAYDEKAGFSLYDGDQRVLHPRTQWLGGLMEEESIDLLQSFFRAKRAQK